MTELSNWTTYMTKSIDWFHKLPDGDDYKYYINTWEYLAEIEVHEDLSDLPEKYRDLETIYRAMESISDDIEHPETTKQDAITIIVNIVFRTDPEEDSASFNKFKDIVYRIIENYPTHYEEAISEIISWGDGIEIYFEMIYFYYHLGNSKEETIKMLKECNMYDDIDVKHCLDKYYL